MDATSPWLSKPTLTGAAVILRPFVASDADAMAGILSDPEVLRLTGSVATTEDIHGQNFHGDAGLRDWYASRADVDARLDLAIVDRENDAVVGEAVLNEFDANAVQPTFAFWSGLREEVEAWALKRLA